VRREVVTTAIASGTNRRRRSRIGELRPSW